MLRCLKKNACVRASGMASLSRVVMQRMSQSSATPGESDTLPKQPLEAACSSSTANEGASSADVVRPTSPSQRVPLPSRRQLRRHPKLHEWVRKELKEEYLRDHRPPLPHVPTGWSLTHEKGSNRFDMKRTVNIGNSGPEHFHIIALMEIKQYEHTYRMDNGEREEEEHLIFSLFLEKERWRQQGGGGLEFTLTSIDHELVVDNLAIHSTPEDFENAKVLNYTTRRTKRDVKYRGPMMSELDDDLTDEIVDYLDARGVNNGLAEYIMAQGHYLEQQSYEDWLGLLKVFAQ